MALTRIRNIRKGDIYIFDKYSPGSYDCIKNQLCVIKRDAFHERHILLVSFLDDKVNEEMEKVNCRKMDTGWRIDKKNLTFVRRGIDKLKIGR